MELCSFSTVNKHFGWYKSAIGGNKSDNVYDGATTSVATNEHAFTGFSIGPPTPTIRRELRHHADEGEATDENSSEATLHVVINASPWAKDIIKVATATEALIGFLLDVAKIAVKGGEAGISGGVTEEEVDEELCSTGCRPSQQFAREKRQLLPLVTSVYHRCWPGTPSERDGVGIQWRLAGSVALAIFEICSRSPRSACTRARGGGSGEASQLEDLRPTLLHHPRRWFSLLWYIYGVRQSCFDLLSPFISHMHT
nr:hypothetical protein Iba_chr05cCG0850 [Ipomoea batatas]